MSVLSTSKLRRLPLGFPTLDHVFSGFELGDIAVLHGNAASKMAFVLSVRAQLSLGHGGLGSSIIFVDGGNMFDPYAIAGIARGYGLDPKEALEKIHISRAFTAYQLSSLILNKLESALARDNAELLVVSKITALFLDRDVPKIEAEELFMKICEKLSQIALRKQTIIIINYSPERRSIRGLFFEAALLGKCNVAIKTKKTDGTLTFALEDHPRLKPFSMDFAVDENSLTPLAEA
jgi:hypothetical protein